MTKLRYAGTEIDFTVERLVEIAQSVIDELMIDGEDTALEYLADTTELTEYEADFFGINYEQMQTYSRCYEFDDSELWEDDSDRGCKDCPPDECTGHCMSCWYRPV